MIRIDYNYNNINFNTMSNNGKPTEYIRVLVRLTALMVAEYGLTFGIGAWFRKASCILW